MTLKAAKEIQQGEFLRSVPRYETYGEVEVLSVFPQTRETALTVMQASGMVINCYVLSTTLLETIEALNFKAVRQKKWHEIMPNLSYKTYNGTDPEIFVTDEHDRVIPAWMFLADKATAARNHRPYWDGFQAEFQVLASTCLNGQNDGTAMGLQAVITAARTKFPKAKLSIKNTVEILPELLLTAKDEHVALGCAPSFNAYGLQGIEVPNPRMLRHRFAGGHIHKSLINLLPAEANRIVKVLDALVAVPCVSMFQKLDDPIRRQFYGLAGEYRLPKHGLEYRVLSNAWLCHPAIAQFTRELFRQVSGIAMLRVEDVFDYKEDEVVRIILDHDVDGAKKLVKRNQKNFNVLLGMIFEKKAVYKGLSLMQGSVTDFVNPLEVEKNWLGHGAWQGNSALSHTRWNSFARL